MLNKDYRDMLHVLSEEKVKFILVEAYAFAAHVYPRATMDIYIWVMPSPENADAVLRALNRLGAPFHNLTKEDLLKDGTIFLIDLAWIFTLTNILYSGSARLLMRLNRFPLPSRAG